MGVTTEQVVATVVLTITMAVAGLGALVWMGATEWDDIAGIVVGVIFIALGVFQALFSVAWYRVNTKKEAYAVSADENGKLVEMQDLKQKEATA